MVSCRVAYIHPGYCQEGHPIKLGLSCAKLRNVELKIKDNKIVGLNENWVAKHEG